MADLNKTTADHMQPYSGSFGNNSVAIFKYEAAAAASADVIYLGKLPKYAYVHNVVMYCDDLSDTGNTTISLGYATAETGGSETSATYWTTTTDVHSAVSRTVSAAEPKRFTEEVYVTATVGTAAATGTIYAIVEFLYEAD